MTMIPMMFATSCRCDEQERIPGAVNRRVLGQVDRHERPIPRALVDSAGREIFAQQMREASSDIRPAVGRRAHDAVQAVHAVTDDQIEAFHERAAILEFDAGMSREQAQKLAARQMLLTPEDLIEFEQGQGNGRA